MNEERTASDQGKWSFVISLTPPYFLPVPTFLSHDLFVFIDLKREVVVRFVDDDGGIFVQTTFS